MTTSEVLDTWRRLVDELNGRKPEFVFDPYLPSDTLARHTATLPKVFAGKRVWDKLKDEAGA